MKPARLAVLAVALLAGVSAMYLMSGESTAPVVQEAPPQVAMTEILVAAADLPLGQALKAEDIRWQPWPESALNPNFIAKTTSPNAQTEMVGSVIRSGFLTNEPLRLDKLVKAGNGFMSAILPAGMRAVAIEVPKGGANSAGGFILPNDFVDVIRIFRQDEGNTSEQISETLLSDIRVLAVGQVVQERNGETVVTADNVTLSLTPAQTETVMLAQKTGQLSLALRSILDSNKTSEVVDSGRSETGLTVVRFGVAKQQPRR